MQVLEAMTQLLAHRGPDGRGVWIDDGIGLAHTRLSILDLSAASSQPMVTSDGSCVLVFNGEIYNYQDLREELQQEGETFRSRSDTEVLLMGYRRWGKSVLERLRGMFAFALWDTPKRKLLLARDRLGIKPLFFAHLKPGIVFASEIKAMLVHPGIRREMNPSAVDAYFELGYIPGPDTVFEGVQALAPGCWLEYAEGSLTTRRYWIPDFSRNGLAGSEDELLEQLDQRLNDAVKSHLVADVSVGAFLSGGIDSSLVCAVAQKHVPKPLRTFTIGFNGGGDERRYARLVAAHIGADHHEMLATPDILSELPRLVKHLEQPLFDNSVLPTHLVSQAARQHVKVVLSGDGGDEPFAGYEWTRRALSLPRAPGSWQPAGWHWAYRSGAAGLAQRLAYDLTHSADDRYQRRVCVSAALRSWLYHPEFISQFPNSIQDSTQHLLDQAPVPDMRDRFIHADLCRYLPEDVLFKVDRMSMANSLEVRVPLLDHHLMEWVLRLPFDMRFRAGRGKYLLRKLAVRYLPPEILKPRKQGFTIPIGDWLRGELGNWVEGLFRSPSFENRRIIRKDAALELLAMHRTGRYELGHRIWQLVMFEVWARLWLDRLEGKDLMAESISAGFSRSVEVVSPGLHNAGSIR
jgi:asparagine synthase (glutamine-hydrolysing)